MTTVESEILAAAAWLREHATAVPFGEIGIRIVLHGGRVARIERTLTTKCQSDSCAVGRHSSGGPLENLTRPSKCQ